MFIILKNIVPLPHYPHAVVGQSGITYGHAMFDPLYQAHIFRLPYEEWAGEKGKDITGRAQGPMNRYHVLVELFEGHVLAPATQLASDLQDALTQLTAVRQENERLAQTGAAVDTTEQADRRVTDSPRALESAAQDSQAAREQANAERRVDVQAPAQGLPAAPTSVEEAQTGFLVAAKNGLPLSEKQVETNPDTGAKELVEREATPVMSGVPNQPPGEVGVTPYVNVHETRTPLEGDNATSNLKETAKSADNAAPVLDGGRVAQPKQTIAENASGTDPIEEANAQARDAQGVTESTDDLDAITNFRTLWSKAKTEGVDADALSAAKSADDLRGLIRQHRADMATASE